MSKLRQKQTGLSLIELMISVVAGMIVVGGATAVYVSTISSSSAVLKQSKLNQEIAALMNVMNNDIRRAGIWGDMDEDDYNNPETNPFSSDGSTLLTVITDMSGAGAAVNPSASNTGWTGGTVTSGSCILYSYDDPGTTQGSVEAGDLRGFRLTTGGVVQMLNNASGFTSHSDNCKDSYWSNGNDWVDLTDSQTINVTSLSFDLANSVCLNTSENNGEDDNGDGSIDDATEIDCYTVAPSSGEYTAETRQVDINITAQLGDDSFIQVDMDQTIRVRNDLVTEQ